MAGRDIEIKDLEEKEEILAKILKREFPKINIKKIMAILYGYELNTRAFDKKQRTRIKKEIVETVTENLSISIDDLINISPDDFSNHLNDFFKVESNKKKMAEIIQTRLEAQSPETDNKKVSEKTSDGNDAYSVLPSLLDFYYKNASGIDWGKYIGVYCGFQHWVGIEEKGKFKHGIHLFRFKIEGTHSQIPGMCSVTATPTPDIGEEWSREPTYKGIGFYFNKCFQFLLEPITPDIENRFGIVTFSFVATNAGFQGMFSSFNHHQSDLSLPVASHTILKKVNCLTTNGKSPLFCFSTIKAKIYYTEKEILAENLLAPDELRDLKLPSLNGSLYYSTDRSKIIKSGGLLHSVPAKYTENQKDLSNVLEEAKGYYFCFVKWPNWEKGSNPPLKIYKFLMFIDRINDNSNSIKVKITTSYSYNKLKKDKIDDKWGFYGDLIPSNGNWFIIVDNKHNERIDNIDIVFMNLSKPRKYNHNEIVGILCAETSNDNDRGDKYYPAASKVYIKKIEETEELSDEIFEKLGFVEDIDLKSIGVDEKIFNEYTNEIMPVFSFSE